MSDKENIPEDKNQKEFIAEEKTTVETKTTGPDPENPSENKTTAENMEPSIDESEKNVSVEKTTEQVEIKSEEVIDEIAIPSEKKGKKPDSSETETVPLEVKKPKENLEPSEEKQLENRSTDSDKIKTEPANKNTEPSEENSEKTPASETDNKRIETEESTKEDLQKKTISSEPKNAQSEMDDAVAEDREDESAGRKHEIEKKDYHAMDQATLVAEFATLIKKEKIQTIKDHVDEIRTEFNAKFEEDLEQKKEEFLADGGNIIDFHYSTPLKKEFNSLYFDYKEKRNKYYQQLKQDLNKNLKKRLEIIEELKGLIDVEENINTTYKHFKELQERWRNAGGIPRDAYNTVWNTYHHHVENFYDFLHLNREFRDLDFKHNLEQKLKIISRAEELTQETDTNRAFRELQMLHKMWKEDLGPVERIYREDIWQKFSEATKNIHDNRQEHFNQLEKDYEKNLEKKEVLIEKIKEIAETKYTSHRQWQQKIKEVSTFREEFFQAGKVPRNLTDQTWKRFKEVVRTFNRNKNSFYKDQKKEQYKNLEKKRALIQIAEDNKDSEDYKATSDVMKKIQSDWKKIGHVPRRDSDKVWKQFKTACNHYFDRLHASRNEENKGENEAFDKKKDLLDALKNMEYAGERKKDLPVIKEYIDTWKNSGKVPHNKRYIEGKFNKALDQAFEKLDLDKTQTELLKYENKIQALENAEDSRKIENEHYFLTKKVEETKSEIRQLENNLQFFSNVDDDNPLVKDVHKNIQDQKDQLEIWKGKLQKVKSLY